MRLFLTMCWFPYTDTVYRYLKRILSTWINFIPQWISNYIHYNVWDEVTQTSKIAPFTSAYIE